MSDLVQIWTELSHDEREQAIDALVKATIEGEPVPEIRAARCYCGLEQVTSNLPFRIKGLYGLGWRWRRAIHVPLDFSGNAGCARWLCPACARGYEERETREQADDDDDRPFACSDCGENGTGYHVCPKSAEWEDPT